MVPEACGFMMGLAGLDCRLLRKDRTLIPKVKDPSVHGVNAAERIDYATFSILWVFGAYEVIRTLHQRLRESPDARVQRSELCFRTGELKKRFERVRIPLAKFEIPHAFPSDRAVVLPAVDFEKGAAWFVSPTEHISRRDLSDAFLETLQDWNQLIQREHAR